MRNAKKSLQNENLFSTIKKAEGYQRLIPSQVVFNQLLIYKKGCNE